MSYNYRWRPNKSQRRAFAERMQDPEEQQAYNNRKAAKETKFYESFEEREKCFFKVTDNQRDIAKEILNAAVDDVLVRNAAIEVINAWSTGDKVDHNSIHLIHEWYRSRSSALTS